MKKSAEFSLDSEEEIASLFSYASNLKNTIFKLVDNQSGTVVRLKREFEIEQTLAEVEHKLGAVPESVIQVSSQTSLPCLNSEPNVAVLQIESAIDSNMAESQNSEQEESQREVLKTESMDIEETVN